MVYISHASKSISRFAFFTEKVPNLGIFIHRFLTWRYILACFWLDSCLFVCFILEFTPGMVICLTYTTGGISSLLLPCESSLLVTIGLFEPELFLYSFHADTMHGLCTNCNTDNSHNSTTHFTDRYPCSHTIDV